MDDLISRKDEIDAIVGFTHMDWESLIILYHMLEVIDNLPSAEPVKHEECEYIITKGKAGYHEEYKCSVCGDSFYWTPSEMFPNKFNYCRNCGRKIVKLIDESEE